MQGSEYVTEGTDMAENTSHGPSEKIERIDLHPGSGFAFSSCVIAGDYLLTSHHAGFQAEEGSWPGGVEAQTEQCFRNLEQTLGAAGATLGDVVKTTVFLQDMGEFSRMNGVYAQFFVDDPPARSAVQVVALPLGGLVEIEAVAEACDCGEHGGECSCGCHHE